MKQACGADDVEVFTLAHVQKTTVELRTIKVLENAFGRREGAQMVDLGFKRYQATKGFDEEES